MQRTSTYGEAQHEGWMTKKGKIRRNWQRRWFILEDGQLKYFKSKITETQKGKVKPTGVILVGGCEFGPTAAIGSKYENCFQVVYLVDWWLIFQLVTTTRTYFMYTETPAEFESWKQKLIASGAKWNGAVKSRATIREDGSIEEGKDKSSSSTDKTTNNNNSETKPPQTTERKSTLEKKQTETASQQPPQQTEPAKVAEQQKVEPTQPTTEQATQKTVETQPAQQPSEPPKSEPVQSTPVEAPKPTETTQQPVTEQATQKTVETQPTQQPSEPPKSEPPTPAETTQQAHPEPTQATEQNAQPQQVEQTQQPVVQPTETKPVEQQTQAAQSPAVASPVKDDKQHVHEYDEDDEEEEEEVLSELTFDLQLRQEAQYFTPIVEKPSESAPAAESKTDDAESEEKEDTEESKEKDSQKLELPTWDPVREGGYNPLLDGTNQPGIAEAIADLVSLDAQGYMEVGSRQAALLEYFQYINNMKNKESLEMGYEQFANAEVLALIAEEFSGKTIDAKWHPFTSAEKPKEDEYSNQLSNHDQILAFMNDTKLFPKKEILPLIRTLISVNAFKGRDSFASTLKDRLLALKKAYDSLSERPSKPSSQTDEAESKSTLPTVVQVVLTATIDLISSPFVSVLVKSPESSQVAVSVLDTLLNSLRKFPLLSLCVNNKLDKLTLEGVFKLTKWLSELSAVAPSVRQKVMQVLIELTLATGSVELMMSVLAQSLRLSSKEAKEYFPLHGIHERLDQLQTLYIDNQVEGQKADVKKPSLGVSSRLLGVWDNFNIVTTNNVFDNEMLSTQQQLRTIASDGSYLYIHDSFGLRKIGTGYHGTTKAKVYASEPDYRPLEKLWLVCFNNKLYCSTADDQVTNLIVLSCDTLLEVEPQPLSFPEPQEDQPAEEGQEEDEISKQYVLTSDGFYFYVLRQKSASSALLVDVYEPHNTKGAVSSFTHVRRVVLKGKAEDKFTLISAERFPMGSYITNGRNLLAVVPPAHRQSYVSPEECNVFTWDISNGAYVENHIDVEMGSTEPTISRAFFNTTFDNVNNIIWSYAPYSKKMRLFEPLGLPTFSGSRSLGYPLPVHEFHSIFRHYHIDSSDSVTSTQLATTLVGHAVRLTQAIRPNLEEVSLPPKGPTPYNPSAPYSGITTAEARKKEKQVSSFVPLQVPFAVQPSNQTFAQFYEVLNYLTSVYEEKADVLREWLLLSTLKLLRANLFAWMVESQNAPNKPKLDKELSDKYSELLKRLLSSKSTRNTLSLVLAEVCESIIIGLDVLYPTPESQLEALTSLIDSCIQTRTTHVLALRLQSLDLSQWLSESESTSKVTEQLNTFIDKLLSRVDDSTKAYLQERISNPDAKMKDHSSELHILFVYQKQLINTAIKSSQSEPIQKSVIQFAAKVVTRSVEVIELLIKNSSQLPVDLVESLQILTNTVVGTLLSYLVTALPVVLTSTADALKHLSPLLIALDRLNHQRSDLAAQLDKFDTTEPVEKKIGSKTAKLKIPPSLPFLLDLERQTAWAAGKLASTLVKGPTVTEHEIQFKTILGFEVFARGISSEFLQNHSKICASNAGQSADPQLKYLETFIQENSKTGLYTTVATTLNKGRPPAPQAEDVATLERTVIAVLLKHLNLVNVAMDQADLIAKGQSSKEFPELGNVWSKAEKYRKWAVQEAQKMTSNSESESTDAETPVQILTRKARFLLYMTTPEELKSDKPKFSLSDIANKWKQTVKKAQSQEQIEQSQASEQEEEKVGWGRFFQIWKAKRQVPIHEEFEKMANEVISFLKDENTTDLNSFCSAVKSQSERASSRIQGLNALQSLLAQVKLPVAKLDIVGNLTVALRKTESIEQKQLHSVLDNIQTSGQKLTEQTLNGFNQVYSQLKDLLISDNLKPITKLALLDIWNISFEKNEKFITDSGILDVLLQVHKATHDKVAKKESLKSSATPVTRGKEKEKNKDIDGFEALYNTSWLVLRSIFLESIQKKQTDNQATITSSFIQKFYNELQFIVEKTNEQAKQEKPEEDFKQPGIEDEIQQQFIERILVALYSMCQKYSHVHTRHLGTSKWVQLLLNLIRCTSLKSKVISFRLLRLLLPKVEASALASLKLSVSANPAQGLDLLSFFFQFIGAAYEGSSDNCAETVQSMVFVNTTHDIFAVATEAIMLIRLLINDSAWKSKVLALITESINRLGHLFSGPRDRSRTRSRSRTRTTISKEMNANWNIIAALCVLGGNRDTLRLGARVTLQDAAVESEDNEGENATAQNLGTVVEFHRMNPSVKVIQDSHKESIKLDVNKLAGVVEVAPDLSVVLTPSHLANVVSIIKQKESNEASQTLFFQLRSAVLKILGEILESEDSDKVKEMLINDGFVVPLVELCLTPSQFKSELSIGQLLELSQCLHEVLLSEKETPKCSIAMTAQTSTVNVEQRVQKLVELGYIYDWEINEARLSFSQLDLNGDGVLTPEEVMEASGLNLDEDEAAAFREQLLRADRNKDGAIDFLEFVMMNAGLIDFCFPDEDEEEDSSKKVPTLQIQRPALIAGSYKLVLKNGQTLPEQSIAGDLIDIEEGKEYSQEDIKDTVLLVDTEKVGKSIIEAAKEWESKGVVAIIIIADKVTAELNDDSSIKIPVLALSPNDANTICSAIGVSTGPSNQNDKEEEEVEDESQALLEETHFAVMQSMGFEAEQVNEAVEKFGIKNLGACIGWLYLNYESQLKAAVPVKAKEEAEEKEDKKKEKKKKGLSLEDLSVQDVDQPEQENPEVEEESVPEHDDEKEPVDDEEELRDYDEEQDGQFDLFGGFTAALSGLGLAEEDDEEVLDQEGSEHDETSDSEDSDKKDKKDETSEPTYLAKFISSGTASIPVADQSKSNKKSFIAQFDELDLSNLRGELIRVERAITAHHSRQAIISILSKWPSSRPLTSQSLGVDSASVIQIFRFAVSMLKSPARLEHLYKVFVPLLEEKDSNLGAQFMQECIGHIIMQSRIPAAARKEIPRESSNIYFSLAVLQVFLRSQSGLSAYSNLLVKLVTELIRALEVASPHLRVAIVNVLTQIMLSIRNNPQAYKAVNTVELSNSLKIIQSLLQKQFLADRKKNYAVGSLYLQAVAELVAVGQSMILVLSDLKEKPLTNSQKLPSLSLLEGLYQERASEKEDEGAKLVGATVSVKMIISDDGCSAKADLGPYDSAFVSVTCSKFITSGKYYYEAVIKRDEAGSLFGGGGKMVAQIGWANKKFKANELEGLGVGDDEHSWGYDGGRLRKWHKGKWTTYSKTAWKEDDIIGCAVDLDAGKMSFFLNGKLLGEAFSDVTVPEGGICPAATYRNDLSFQFNFGKDAFQYPLPGYQSLDPLQADPESGLKLPDFELYCRNFHLINALYTRSSLSDTIIKYAAQRHQKVIQKVSNKIKLKLVSADGKSDTYNVADNILKEGHAYYSTEKAKNVNVILTSESEFLTKVINLDSHRGYGVANPVKNALVFITDEKPEVSQFASYDNFTQEKWDKFVQEKNGEALSPTEPVAYLHIQSGSSAVFKLDNPKKGKFILLKLLSSSSSSRMDVTHFSIQGLAGPFSPLESQIDSISLADVKCNNDSWTLELDAQLVSFCNIVSQRTTTSPLLLSAGQLLSFMSDPQITHAIPILKQVKPEALLFRYYILALFNSELNSFFYWVNLENLKDYSIATKLSHLRSCIFLEIKTKFLDNVLDGIVTANPPGQNIKLNRAKALQQRDGTAPKNDLDTLFGQAFTQMSQANPSLFRALEQAWSVTFLGEGSIDAGGPYRESLSQFCTELQSEALSLLQKSPNGQHNVGFNREMWVPVASAKSNVQISMYEFLGKLFGLALCSSFTLNLDLASMVYKPLVGQQLDINDLKAVDSMCVQSLEALRSIDKQGITEDMFEDVFLEVFTINGSDGKVIELVPGGKDKPVTFQNRFEWAELVEKTRINEFKLQVEAIKRGIATVIPTPVLGLFSWEELKISIEGKPTLDIPMLKEKTVYRAGYTENSEPVKLFWKVLDALTPEQHGLFLRFTWGRSRLPLYVDQFTQEFKISKMYSETPDKTLPLSHTCFFELELPEYSTFEIMKDKLVYAITECQAIDTDFNPTSAANWE